MKRSRASGYVACMQIKHLQALSDKWAQHTGDFVFWDRLHYDVVEESQGSLMLNCSVRCAVMLVVRVLGLVFFWMAGRVGYIYSAICMHIIISL